MVGLVSALDDETRSFGPVDESNCAVMAKEQVLCDVTDRRKTVARVAADGEHQLVMGRRNARRFCLMLAPSQKPS